MPRELGMATAPAPAMVPTISVAGFSLESLRRIVTKPDLETKVIGAWVLWLALRYLQSFLSNWRCRSRHWFIQYGAMAAYYGPTLIAFYAANAVYSSTSDLKIGLSLGCSFLLFASARGAVTMTRFTLGNSSHRIQSWRLLPWLLYLAWLQWGSIWLNRKLKKFDIVYLFFVCFAPVAYVVIAKPRVAILDYETKKFADYMTRASSTSPSPFFDADASSLHDGCKYPFMQNKEGTWIGFSDVLIKRLARQPQGDDPDICLSYIFCRLLARRYFGFPCAEEGNPQVRQLVLTELLADYNKGFSLVDVQLALLYDYFFTNYHSKITSGFVSVKKGMLELLYHSVCILVGLVIACLYLGYFKKGGPGVVYFVSTAVPALLLNIVIELPQQPFLPRYWRPIQDAILFFDESALHETAAPSGPRKRLYYWRDKLSQYSVMEDYDNRSPMKKIIAWLKVHILSQVSYSFIKHHPAEGKEVSVPDNVRRLVACTIKELDGPPSLGVRSLENFRALDDLSWTCRQETLTHTVLIWHIATCYCDMVSQSQPPMAADANTNHEVATVLSRYCAYLLAFRPELLPEHALTVKVILQQVLQEPRDVLGRTQISMEEKRTRIQELQLPEDESSLTTFQKGVQLGRQLERQADVSLRWKIMADFWAEMILYLASSDNNAAAHIEQLAQGGEFVTHLWALLSNAGILNQTTKEWTAIA